MFPPLPASLNPANAQRKGKKKGAPTRNLDSKYSHPVTSSNSSVGIGGVETATLHDFAALAGNGAGFGGSGLVGQSSGSRCTALLVFGILVLLGVGGVDDHGSVLLVFVDGPVKDIVVLERFADKEVAENLAQIGVVGLVVET
jgi:hypothetical protein